MNRSGLLVANRLLLLFTSLLAGYQIAVGMEGLSLLAMSLYTLAFGILLVTALLVLILGFEAFDSNVLVILSTIIPLSFAAGLVGQSLPAYQWAFLGMAAFSLTVLLALRSLPVKKGAALASLVIIHGLSGVTIVGLPVYLVFTGQVLPGFLLVSLGGADIGVGGLLLCLHRIGRAVISRETAMELMPALLFFMTLAFVGGFRLG